MSRKVIEALKKLREDFPRRDSVSRVGFFSSSSMTYYPEHETRYWLRKLDKLIENLSSEEKASINGTA